MSQNIWKKLLKHLVLKEPRIIISEFDSKRNKKIRKLLECSHDELIGAFEILKQLEYIKLSERFSSKNGEFIELVYYLTPKGAEVGLEFQKYEDNEKYNLVMVFLTTILALGVINEISGNLTFFIEDENYLKFSKFIIAFVSLLIIIFFSKIKKIEI